VKRSWPHLVGLVLCGAAFSFGHARVSRNLGFWSDLHDATGLPLAGMLFLSPCTYLVILATLVLSVLAFKCRCGLLTIAVYAVFAGYWAWLADALHDLDL
jgi:hypothetical protein